MKRISELSLLLRMQTGQYSFVDYSVTLYGSRNNCFGPLHITDDKLRWVGPEAWRFMYDGKIRWKYEYNLNAMGILAGPEIRYYK